MEIMDEMDNDPQITGELKELHDRVDNAFSAVDSVDAKFTVEIAETDETVDDLQVQVWNQGDALRDAQSQLAAQRDRVDTIVKQLTTVSAESDGAAAARNATRGTVTVLSTTVEDLEYALGEMDRQQEISLMLINARFEHQERQIATMSRAFSRVESVLGLANITALLAGLTQDERDAFSAVMRSASELSSSPKRNTRRLGEGLFNDPFAPLNSPGGSIEPTA